MVGHLTGRKGKIKIQLSSHSLSNNSNKIHQHKRSMDLNKAGTVEDGQNI